MINTAFRFLLLLTIGLLSVAGCDREETTETTNSQPVIDRVVVPEEVKAGETVKLEVIAHDADGDALTYNWDVSAGTVDAAGLWTVPSEATGATVLVHVSDGVNSAVASSRISVEVVAPPKPPKPVAPEPVAPEGMVLIPAGEFQMGSNDPEAGDDEQPVHTVYVDAFFMDETEVTNAQYKEFIDANPGWGKRRIDGAFHNGNYLKHWNGDEYPRTKSNHPVVYVSWYAAMAYAQWAGKRLPTEAEWEYAARGGLRGQKYPWWGDVIDGGRANYNNHVKDTTAVRKYGANDYGLFDMAGNVWEWCLDEYDKGYYLRSPRENPLSGAPTIDWVIINFTNVKTKRVLRGGSWLNGPGVVRVANRGRFSPSNTNNSNGFRCARSQ